MTKGNFENKIQLSKAELKDRKRRDRIKGIKKYWQLYLLILIPVIITFVYKYIPMWGIQIAFKDYSPSAGFLRSESVGFKWFRRFFASPNINRMIKNTVLLSVYTILWSFPIPIILSLMINQIYHERFKRTLQTVTYAPHFISIMVVTGMIRIFLSPYGGLVNLVMDTNVDWLTEPEAFRTIYVASEIWQNTGWNSIIYVASLSAIDQSLYEAAEIDGATLWQKIRYIDLPTLVPVMVLNLIMAVGGIMSIGFEKVYLLQTDLNKAASDVISVYVYQQGLVNQNYSYATAVGLFNTVINVILVLIVNRIADKYSEISIV